LYAQSSKLVNWLSALAFAVLIAFCVIGVGTWRLHSPAFVSVHSTDLTQFAQPGDAVVAHTVKLHDVQPGDVVSFYDPQNTSSITTERVGQVDQSERSFKPMPSGTHQKIQPIDSSLLIGKVDYRLAKLGYVLDFVHSRIGLIVGAYLPALFIFGQELKQLAISYDRPTYRLLSFARRA
jgi:hypothetical protein